MGAPIDEPLAESAIGLYKTELVRNKGPWRTFDALEIATLEWVDCFNHRRIHGEIGDLTPAELEVTHYRQQHPAIEAGIQ